QECQLQAATKSNEEAQVLINDLRASLVKLEARVKQADATTCSLGINRQKDCLAWKRLALDYEMKISYLEKALRQEECKLRIAEQVHREEGLELHLELISRQRGDKKEKSKQEEALLEEV
ncbi:unnamed protein product, partial [Choristocarpus tenellus]